MALLRKVDMNGKLIRKILETIITLGLMGAAIGVGGMLWTHSVVLGVGLPIVIGAMMVTLLGLTWDWW